MFVLYILFLTFLFIFYVKRKQSYWKRRDVFEFETEFLVGSRRKEATAQESVGEASLKRYKILKDAKQKHGGSYLFLEPIYMVIDPEIIKHIMLKDFSHFMDRGRYYHPDDILVMNVFNMEGDEWKNLRAKLTPTFTSGKIKMMLDIILEKTVKLKTIMENDVNKQEPCDLKELLTRFTTDVVGSCTLGFECNSLEDPEVPFRKYGKLIAKPRRLRYILIQLLPWKLLRTLKVNAFAPIVNKFFVNILKGAIKYRETNESLRKDFVQLLLDLKMDCNSTSPVTLTENQIISQCFAFFFAGFETSALASTFAIYELSRHPDIQEKLRQEILEVLKKYNGEITYDAVMEMVYLDQVYDESLRMYPPLPVIPRVCIKSYNVPGTDLLLEKGTRIEVPVWAIQNDPEYFPNPEKFDPENFNEDNKAKRAEFTFFPFGIGPRKCIGIRFAKLQSKVALITLLRNYKFSLNEKSLAPLKLETGSALLSVTGNLWFDVTRV